MKLTVRNFQGHKDSTIETFGGITALTGSTNAGKSSFIRAFHHLKDNNLRGTSFIRKGCSDYSIILDDVERAREGSFNGYKINGDTPEALKTGVPIEVTKALNLADCCVQMQHDSIFLLNKSGGHVAQQLSELIDLEQAHKAVKITDGERKDAYKEMNALSISLTKREERVEELNVIDTIDIALEILEKKAAKINEYRQTQATLRVLIETAAMRRSELSKLPDVSKLNKLPVLLKTGGSIQQEQTAINAVRHKCSVAKMAQKKLMKVPDNLMPEIADMLKEAKSLKGLSSIIRTLQTEVETKRKYKEELTSLEEQYTELLGDTCPLCGSTLNVQ